MTANLTQKAESATIGAINRLYDDRMYERLIDEYYGGSGFLNFGYWDESTCNAREASERLMEKLLALMNLKPGSVLDVACGTGGTTQYLLKFYQPGNVVGINISEKQLHTCRDKLAPCAFLKMDAAHLGFAGESFDNIICVEAAFHFHTRERFLGEAYRVLKPGGVLLLTDVLISPVNLEQRPHWHEKNLVTDSQDYAAICRKAGFSRVEIVDATKECWHGGFWSVIRFAHEKFLWGIINLEELNAFLERIYRLAEDLEHYLLVAALKPA